MIFNTVQDYFMYIGMDLYEKGYSVREVNLYINNFSFKKLKIYTDYRDYILLGYYSMEF